MIFGQVTTNQTSNFWSGVDINTVGIEKNSITLGRGQTVPQSSAGLPITKIGHQVSSDAARIASCML